MLNLVSIMKSLPRFVPFFLIVLYISSTTSAYSSSSKYKSYSSSPDSSDLTRKIIKSLAKSVAFNARNSAESNKPFRPMRPIEPLPSNSIDYITPIINLFNNVREMESNLKKKTYSYGLMVVGRPLEELTMAQKLVRAALMPGKYYEDATSAVAKQLNKFVINKPRKDIHRNGKSRPSSSGSPKSFDWGDVILRLITLAASSIPTPVVKH